MIELPQDIASRRNGKWILDTHPNNPFMNETDTAARVTDIEYGILSGRYQPIKTVDGWIRGQPQRRLTATLFGACPFLPSKKAVTVSLSEREKTWVEEYDQTIEFVPQIIRHISSLNNFKGWLNKRPALLQAIAAYEPYVVVSQINAQGLFKMSYSDKPPKKGEDWFLINAAHPTEILAVEGVMASKIVAEALKMKAIEKAPELNAANIAQEIRKVSLYQPKRSVTFGHAGLDSDRPVRDVMKRFSGKVIKYSIGTKVRLGPTFFKG